MKKVNAVQKNVYIIKKMPKIYQDVLIFRYVYGFANGDIEKLLEFTKEEVNRIFLNAELAVRLIFEKQEEIELSDDVMKAAAEIVLEKWAEQFPDDGDYGEWQPSEEFKRKIRAIYMDEDTEAISKNEMLN